MVRPDERELKYAVIGIGCWVLGVGCWMFNIERSLLSKNTCATNSE